jgi:hypothetical protein
MKSMRHLQFGVLAVLAALGVSIHGAQETKKVAASETKCCGLTGHQLFCGDEKCDSDKCKENCEKACVTLRAVGAKIRDMAKTEWGDKACECRGTDEAKICEGCRTFCREILVPKLKDRIATRTADPSIKHSVKNTMGKTEETPCTFLSGGLCALCVTEISDKSFAQLKERKAAKEAPKAKE